MGLLFLLAVLVGLVFPPFAIVVLAMMVLGVFAKGMVADSQEQFIRPTRKIRHRHSTQRPQDAVSRYSMAPWQGTVIDVRCYPTLPPLCLSTPMPKPLDRLS